MTSESSIDPNGALIGASESPGGTLSPFITLSLSPSGSDSDLSSEDLEKILPDAIADYEAQISTATPSNRWNGLFDMPEMGPQEEEQEDETEVDEEGGCTKINLREPVPKHTIDGRFAGEMHFDTARSNSDTAITSDFQDS